MDIKDLPFRLDDRTAGFFAGLVGACQRSKAKLQGSIGSVILLFDGKDTADVRCDFTSEFMQLHYPLRAVADGNDELKAWLKNLHATLEQNRGNLRPVVPRCFISVKVFYDGNVEYYLTYMCAHPDNSLAQDMPQGTLYARESVAFRTEAGATVKKQPVAKDATQEAAWLNE